MGRGLSDLQKTILRLAYEHRRREMDCEHVVNDRSDAYETKRFSLGLPQRCDLCDKNLDDPDEYGNDLYNAEVLAAYFGWKPARKDDDLRSRGQNFSKQRIGIKPYAAATASLSRAVLRLHQRGLVTAYWACLTLTEEGIAEAERLQTLNQKQ